MKLAIMQPYIFPHIGYFQLIKSVDKFVFYDDVDFIKQGWVNRNYILVNGQKFQFTIPLKSASSNHPIGSIEIDWNNKIVKKFIKTLKQSYRKAPYFERTIGIVEESFEKKHSTIAQLCIETTKTISTLFHIGTRFEISSQLYHTSSKRERADRIYEICKKNKANTYINSMGGMDLYSKEDFKNNQIELFYLEPGYPSYTQFENEFMPGLSILDILMFNSIDKIDSMLTKYRLV